MPMPYSHLAVAHSCLPQLDTQDLTDFYLGAFMPDIRYFTAKPRALYHFPAATLDERIQTMDVPPSFALGYKIHLILDELWSTPGVKQDYQAAFLRPIRKRLTPRMLEVAFELFCLDQRPIAIHLEVRENDLTRSLDITAADLSQAVALLQQYLDRRSLREGFLIAQSTGKYPPARLAELNRFSEIIESHRLARSVVRSLIKRPSQQLHTRLVDGVFQRIGVID
jgi:hypothetical protein